MILGLGSMMSNAATMFDGIMGTYKKALEEGDVLSMVDVEAVATLLLLQAAEQLAALPYTVTVDQVVELLLDTNTDTKYNTFVEKVMGLPENSVAHIVAGDAVGNAVLCVLVAEKEGADVATIMGIHANQNAPGHAEVVAAVETFRFIVKTIVTTAETLDKSASVAAAPLATPELLGNILAESEFAGLLGLFGRCIIGNGLGAHPSAEGHKALADAVIAAYEGNYTAQKETFKNLIYVLVEYYDEAYALAYELAVKEGYIAEANAYLDTALAAIADAEAWVEANAEYVRSEEFALQVAVAFAEAKASVEALRNLINNADALDAETNALVVALGEELLGDVEALNALLQIATVDAGAYLDPKIAVINRAVVDAVDYTTYAVLEMTRIAVEYVKENLPVAYDNLVQALLAALPEVDAWLYNWFYENPDVVIGFFAEYSDEMLDFIVDNHKTIFAVFAFIGMNYGEDILCYVINNADVILPAIVSWFDTYGDRAWAMVKVYLNALGVNTDILTPEGILAALGNVFELMVNLGEEFAEEAWNKLLESGILEEIVEALNDAKDQALDKLHTLENDVKGQLTVQLNALKSELESLKSQLEEAVAANNAFLKAKLEAEIAKVEAAIERIEAELAKVDAKILELKAVVDQLIAKIEETVALVNQIVEFIQSGIESDELLPILK